MFTKKKIEAVRKAVEEFIATEPRGSISVLMEAAGCSRQNFHKFRNGANLGDQFLRNLQEFLQSNGRLSLSNDDQSQIRPTDLRIPDMEQIFSMIRKVHKHLDGEKKDELIGQLLALADDTDEVIESAEKLFEDLKVVNERLKELE